MPEIQGYCMKCKAKRQMKNCEKVMMGKKKNRAACKGKCTQCSTNMYKILSKEDAAKF